MTLETAMNRAERLAAMTGRRQYVVGNGLGHYWTEERLPVIPMSGMPVRPAATVEAPPAAPELAKLLRYPAKGAAR